MKRQEFIETVNTWNDLCNFCHDEYLALCDDIVSERQRDDFLDSNLDRIFDSRRWQDVYWILDCIPEGFEYYKRDEYSYNFLGLTDSDPFFSRRKQEVLEAMDLDDSWDEEDTNTESYADEQDELEIDTSISLDDFFAQNAKDFVGSSSN